MVFCYLYFTLHTVLKFVFEIFFPTYFSTDFSVNFIQESHVLRLSVAKQQHLNNPLYVRLYVPKRRFSAKKGVHCCDGLLSNRKRFSLYFLTVTDNIKISTDTTFRY